MGIERTEIQAEQETDLRDLSGIVPENTDMFAKMNALIDHTDSHLSEIAEENDNRVFEVAEMRLGVTLGNLDDSDKGEFLLMLDGSLNA